MNWAVGSIPSIASSQPPLLMQRILLAVIAAILTISGIVLMGFESATYSAAASACLRSGLVLGALALALPQVKRLFEVAPPWFLACTALGLLLIIRWPRSIGIVLPALVALWFLGPRSKRAAPTNARARSKAGHPRKAPAKGR